MKSLQTLRYKTLSATPPTIVRKWYEIDAKDQIVGRLSSQVIGLLSGKKRKPCFTPHMPCGDHVVIINADQVRFTGKKEKNKEYIRHTRYPGGQRSTTPFELRAKNPTQILRHSIKGMMMKNKLGRQLLRNLHIYAGAQHPHEAQNLEKINPSTL